MHVDDVVQRIKEGVGAPALAQNGPGCGHLVRQDLLDAFKEVGEAAPWRLAVPRQLGGCLTRPPQI